jgi:hypothetical protein
MLYYYLMKAERHTLQIGSHLLGVRLSRGENGTDVVLELDGRGVARRTGWPVVRVPLADLDLPLEPGLEEAAVVVAAFRPGRGTVRLAVPPSGGSVPGLSRRPERRDFEPPTGTSAHRRYLWAERHPGLYAARHVVVATAQVVGGLLLARLALGFVLHLDWGWLPDWRLPSLPRPDLPDLPWPDVPWPDLDVPDWSLPGWLVSVIASKKYWLPVLVAVGVAVAEVRRRRARETDRENAAWPAPSTPSGTRNVDSPSSTRP